MTRQSKHVFAIAQLGFWCAFLSFTMCNSSAAQLTFKQAVELAARHGIRAAVAVTDQEKAYQAYMDFNRLSVPHSPLGSAADYSAEFGNALDGSADVTSQALINLAPISIGRASQALQLEDFAEQDQYRHALLDASIMYAQLSWLNLHLHVLKQQRESAAKLVNVEKMRVSVEVDGEVSLIRARLLEAQTRIRSAKLEGDTLALRNDLAELTGLPEEQIEPIPESIPPLPETEELAAEQTTRHGEAEKLQQTVKELIATRDAAQLAYVLVQRDAIRAAGLDTATLGEQLASQVRYDEKFGALLDATFELQKAEFELLNAKGELERWATAGHPTNSATSSAGSSFKGTAAQPTVRTIMVLPSASSLTVRGCRQLAAVAIGDAGGRDVTSVVKWSSSNESVAIVSTSGLVTGLRSGHVTITASLAGVSRLKPTTIIEEPTGPAVAGIVVSNRP